MNTLVIVGSFTARMSSNPAQRKLKEHFKTIFSFLVHHVVSSTIKQEGISVEISISWKSCLLELGRSVTCSNCTLILVNYSWWVSYQLLTFYEEVGVIGERHRSDIWKAFKKLSLIIILPYIYRKVCTVLSFTLFHFGPYGN